MSTVTGRDSPYSFRPWTVPGALPRASPQVSPLMQGRKKHHFGQSAYAKTLKKPLTVSELSQLIHPEQREESRGKLSGFHPIIRAKHDVTFPPIDEGNERMEVTIELIHESPAFDEIDPQDAAFLKRVCLERAQEGLLFVDRIEQINQLVKEFSEILKQNRGEYYVYSNANR